MKIALDISPLKNENRYRGVGLYTQQLIKSLQSLKISDFSCQLIENKTPDKEYDLIHYPFFDLFFLTLPLRKNRPTVVTIHDVIPLVFSEHYSPGIRGNLKLQIQKISLRGVKAVITDSENSKKDIFKYLNYPKEKIYVIPLAPSDVFKPIANHQTLATIKEKYQLPHTFILYVGDVNYNKNIPGLIKAFAQMRQKTKLVLVGKAFKDETLKETQEIVQLIKSLNLDKDVIRLGWISPENLVAIYNLATIYCQPSLYEGFGLPVLEAMACGCPVVATKISSLPEICDEAAVLVDPYEIDDMAEEMERLITDKNEREKLRKKGLEWVKNFDWERTARKTIEVYKKVMDK